MPRSTKRKQSSAENLSVEARKRSKGHIAEVSKRIKKNVARQPLPPQFSLIYQLKPFTAICSECGARHWVEEKTSGSSIKKPKFSMCCAKGKVDLPAPAQPPVELTNYLLDQTEGKN